MLFVLESCPCLRRYCLHPAYEAHTQLLECSCTRGLIWGPLSFFFQPKLLIRKPHNEVSLQLSPLSVYSLLFGCGNI